MVKLTNDSNEGKMFKVTKAKGLYKEFSCHMELRLMIIPVILETEDLGVQGDRSNIYEKECDFALKVGCKKH